MTYTVEISTSAAKSIARIQKKTRLRIIGAIELLALEPRPPGVKLLRAGEQGRWRARVGDYRIVYTIEDDRLIVLVLRVAHAARSTTAEPGCAIARRSRRRPASAHSR